MILCVRWGCAFRTQIQGETGFPQSVITGTPGSGGVNSFLLVFQSTNVTLIDLPGHESLRLQFLERFKAAARYRGGDQQGGGGG